MASLSRFSFLKEDLAPASGISWDAKPVVVAVDTGIVGLSPQAIGMTWLVESGAGL